jgi:pimeloyl-ACP methyl ester carboxylesterase
VSKKLAYKSFITATCLGLFLISSSAWSATLVEPQDEIIHLRTDDQVHLKLFFRAAEPQSLFSPHQTVLLLPGVTENFHTLTALRNSFTKKGLNVYTGQVRLAGRVCIESGECYTSGTGEKNGLTEVISQDTPAILRAMLRHSGAEKIHLIGHSMGGIQIMGLLSNPEHREEFLHRISGITLIAAPHELSAIPPWLNFVAQSSLALLKTLLKKGIQEIKIHHHFFDLSYRAKKESSLWKLPFTFTEELAHRLVQKFLHSVLINEDYVDSVKVKALLRKQISTLPVEILHDFAETLRSGEILLRDGNPAIDPTQITVPTQIISADDDLLVPLSQQRLLFTMIPTPYKQWITLSGEGKEAQIKHLDPILFEGLALEHLIQLIFNFQQNPQQLTLPQEFQIGLPNLECQALLTRET